MARTSQQQFAALSASTTQQQQQQQPQQQQQQEGEQQQEEDEQQQPQANVSSDREASAAGECPALSSSTLLLSPRASEARFWGSLR
jgi:hypothetical protein